jgi:hypothetical protein
VLIDDDGQIIAGHGRVEADLFAHEAVETTLGTEALAHAVFSALRSASASVRACRKQSESWLNEQKAD